MTAVCLRALCVAFIFENRTVTVSCSYLSVWSGGGGGAGLCNYLVP